MADIIRVESEGVGITGGDDGEAVWRAELGHTGRVVRGGDAMRLAQDWAASGDRNALLAHAAAAEFRQWVPLAPRLAVGALDAFRGKRFDPSMTPQSDDMQPPPPGARTPGGRYDRPREPALYLSTSEAGVRQELNWWDGPGDSWVQHFRIPTTDLVIADFTIAPPDHFVTAVFVLAEAAKVPAREDVEYVFSQTVGELVAERWDGMMIPGVRGAPGTQYRNVVLFKPNPEWRRWLAPGEAPYRLLDAP